MNVLPLQEFDMILGMDWLSKHFVVIDCNKKIVKFKFPEGELKFYGERGISSMIITYMKAYKFVSKGCQCFLTQVNDTNKEVKELKDIPVIREYPEVFLDDLSGLPPEREIDFTIELIPGSEPVARAPYRMAVKELQELKGQL
ncbi:hypothetical protein MA16_Dca025119 [Dendrobium catenatum]|uniref:Reverse transcriptase/retrotransposon-derived protein RNase H-like domain-containing protein n=1 Tax=Dendrobium catenatum TaxID=906689 RepID=A0A2I0WKZ3_9ASPA|nr:hypothetical protein MA16_Dca025119 [Dendrobium catenatum]